MDEHQEATVDQGILGALDSLAGASLGGGDGALGWRAAAAGVMICVLSQAAGDGHHGVRVGVVAFTGSTAGAAVCPPINNS